MNTRDMPEEEELDQMFRQAADLYQPEFDPEAWRVMEEKLDGPSKPKGFIYRWGKEALVLLLVAITGMFMYLQYQNRDFKSVLEKKPEAENKETSVSSRLQQRPEPVAPVNSTRPDKFPDASQEKAFGPGNKYKKQVPGSEEVAIADKAKNDKSSGYKKNLVTGSALINKGTRGSLSKFESSNTSLQKKIIITNPPQLPETYITSADTQEQDPQEEVLKPAIARADSANEQNTSQSGIINKGEPIPDTEVKTNIPSDSAAAKVKELRTPTLSKLGVSVVLGPDFSTVGFVNPEKASTNIGFIVSYYFTKRWAIATGIVRARKVYGAKPEDYHPGAYYWNGRKLPDRINAVCEVLDIPVNIRYNVVVLPRQSFFVQTGLSSYLMQHEDYRYDYKDYYGKPYSTHWIVTKQNQHFFKVLNVSAGYNRQVGPGISVGAEPFVKIPLAGIGAGKVNLTSMGVLVSIGYRFH